MVVVPNKGGALVLVGGTGRLGLEIAPGLRQAKGYTAFIALVRSQSSPEKIQRLQEAGWTIAVVDDFLNQPALETALAGAHTVVSPVSGADKLSVHTSLVDAAKAAGVRLFVPSQFGVDPRRWEPGHAILDVDWAILDHAAAVGLPRSFRRASSPT